MTTKIPSIANGRLTQPEVDKLMERYSRIARNGDVITHEEIESLIGVSRSEGHYRSVIKKFRQALEDERGVVLDGRTARGVGFRVLTAEDFTTFAGREFRSGYRKTKRAVKVAALAPDDELTPSGRLRRDHALLHMSTTLQSMAGTRKALAAPPQPPSLAPPKK